jgi:hypothetical protein
VVDEAFVLRLGDRVDLVVGVASLEGRRRPDRRHRRARRSRPHGRRVRARARRTRRAVHGHARRCAGEAARGKAFSLLFGRRSLSGSGIGGIAETQARLDFCAEGGVAADVDVIRIEQVNDAYERLLAGDVTYRFVVDTASLNG